VDQNEFEFGIVQTIEWIRKPVKDDLRGGSNFFPLLPEPFVPGFASGRKLLQTDKKER
jgi:hypothetical protein